MRPTRRAVALFAAALPIPWILLAVAARAWPFALDASVLVLVALASDALLSYPRRRLQVHVTPVDAAFVGTAVEVTVTLGIGAGRRPPAFQALLEASGDADPVVTPGLRTIGARDESATFAVVPRRRGILSIDAVWVRWRGPLGLFEQLRRFPQAATTRVFPNIHASRAAEFQLATRDALFGMKAHLEQGQGSEFEALREYVPGHDVRFVDWKHSARHRKLLLKEFRAERNHPIVIAYDTGHLMREPIDGVAKLDHAINAGLLLSWLALRAGDLVGSYDFAARPHGFVPPARGVGRFRHLQQISSSLAYGTDETNYTLGLATLYGQLERRSLIVLFTDFVDTITAELMVESVQRLTRRHLVLFVALRERTLYEVFEAPPRRLAQVGSAVVAYDFLQEREVVFERLRRLGVHCIDVLPERVTVALINRYLLIKQRDLL
ncbi:MAG TPA: DUF58 domain-containing protein [Candidatus Baltobacteraceae bacterium]|nr:DUF58 domain-containing protein [Candidatus Baltobacteraceae bacterium]